MNRTNGGTAQSCFLPGLLPCHVTALQCCCCLRLLLLVNACACYCLLLPAPAAACACYCVLLPAPATACAFYRAHGQGPRSGPTIRPIPCGEGPRSGLVPYSAARNGMLLPGPAMRLHGHATLLLALQGCCLALQ